MTHSKIFSAPFWVSLLLLVILLLCCWQLYQQYQAQEAQCIAIKENLEQQKRDLNLRIKHLEDLLNLEPCAAKMIVTGTNK